MSIEQDYFDRVWALCLKASAICRISPEVIFSQSALETGYGEHAPDNNYFGIKGLGGQKMTTEFVDGKEVHLLQPFAGYDSIEASFNAYALFIEGNERYGEARSAFGPQNQLFKIAAAGYATDPLYFHKVSLVMLNVPSYLKSYNSIVGAVRRAVSPILHSPKQPTQMVVTMPHARSTTFDYLKGNNMNSLSTDEKDIGSWLSSHATALTSVANLLKTVTAAVPLPAAQAVSTAIAGIEALSSQATTVATNVTTAASAVTSAPVLATVESTVETEAFNAAAAAASSAFEDLMSGKPVASIESDAVKAVEDVIIPRGTSN
jgi:hypothetical protein